MPAWARRALDRLLALAHYARVFSGEHTNERATSQRRRCAFGRAALRARCLHHRPGEPMDLRGAGWAWAGFLPDLVRHGADRPLARADCAQAVLLAARGQRARRLAGGGPGARHVARLHGSDWTDAAAGLRAELRP